MPLPLLRWLALCRDPRATRLQSMPRLTADLELSRVRLKPTPNDARAGRRRLASFLLRLT